LILQIYGSHFDW